jgi:hypothetical protein
MLKMHTQTAVTQLTTILSKQIINMKYYARKY